MSTYGHCGLTSRRSQPPSLPAFVFRKPRVGGGSAFFVRRFHAHPMSEARDKMIAALKEIVVPTLRDMGFRGSFPHFRRQRDEQIDILAFQFSQWGGSFVVEIAHCPAAGYTLHTGETIAPDKARVHLQHYRSRLEAWSSAASEQSRPLV